MKQCIIFAHFYSQFLILEGRRVALMLVTRASASAPIPIIRSNADVFDTIYEHRGWGGDGVEASLSGSGSSLANTKRLCGLLGQLVHEASQKLILVAKNAFAAYLVISALSRSVVIIGKSRR